MNVDPQPAADRFIRTDALTLGGQPCFVGSRLPIESVLASLDRGVRWSSLRADHPFLTPAHIDAARAHPRALGPLQMPRAAQDDAPAPQAASRRRVGRRRAPAAIRLMIDDCLPPRFIDTALAAGYPEASCASFHGWATKTDRQLLSLCARHRFVLVTMDCLEPAAPSVEGDPGAEPAVLRLGAGPGLDQERLEQMLVAALRSLAAGEPSGSRVARTSSEQTRPARGVSGLA